MANSAGRITLTNMRIAGLAGALVFLIGSMYLSWQHRFEAASGQRVCRLIDLRQGMSDQASGGVKWLGTDLRPILRMEVDDANVRIVHRLGIPGWGAVNYVRVYMRFRGDRLVPGREVWEDGRMLIEWHRSGGNELKIEPIGSVRGEGTKSDEFVVAAPKGGAVPVLRLEHLGQSGAFELLDFELQEVRETAWWCYGRWALAAAWFAWTYALVRMIRKISLPRAFGAAAIFVTMGVLVVFPGPWKIQRPFGGHFIIKESSQYAESHSKAQPVAHADSIKPAAKTSAEPRFAGPQQALGKIPVQGGLLLKAKYYLEPLRPLLHAALIMMPTLAMAWLAGWRAALLLAMMLSTAIELAQIAFGYGFDRVDVADLAYDALGIAAAMIVARVYIKWRAGNSLQKTHCECA